MRANIAGGDFGEDLAAPRDARHIAVAVSSLAGGHFVDGVRNALLKALIAGGGIVQRAGREIVSERVAGDPHGFPAAVGWGLRFEASVLAHAREQAVGVEAQEIGGVALARRAERAVEQLDVAERERCGFDAGRRVGRRCRRNLGRRAARHGAEDSCNQRDSLGDCRVLHRALQAVYVF